MPHNEHGEFFVDECGVFVAQELADMFSEVEQTEDYEIETIQYAISEVIHQWMDKRSVSRADLAKVLESSRAYVTKMLGGDTNFRVSTLVKVARSLNCRLNVDNLFVPRIDSVEFESTGLNPWDYAENRGLRLVHSRTINEQHQKIHGNESKSEEVPVNTDAPFPLVA